MSTQWESLANEHILGIAPYEPGKPIEELERELGIHDAIKLASNENPLPPSERVRQAVAAALATLNRYPDGSGFYLRQALAKRHGVAPEQIRLAAHGEDLTTAAENDVEAYAWERRVSLAIRPVTTASQTAVAQSRE